MANGSLMKVESIAECILQYFDLHKGKIGHENQFLVFFLSDCLRQVLLYQHTHSRTAVRNSHIEKTMHAYIIRYLRAKTYSNFVQA